MQERFWQGWVQHLEEALRNAAWVEAYHMGNGETLPLRLATNPFTEIYRLVESLR